MSTLLCQVKRRFPVAVVELYGTLDDSSAAGGMVALRERLAEQPVALILDATHLSVVGTAALRALIDLTHQAANWPGAPIVICGAGPRLRDQLGDGVGPAFCPSVADALAVALRRPVPPSQSVRLAPDRTAPSRARGLAAAACRQWGLGRYTDLVEVIVSELVTNAVTHAHTQIEVSVRRSDGGVSLAVRDGDPRLLAEAGGGVAADGHGYGRGLMIVDAMADRWGCVPTGDGKVVWAYVGTLTPAGRPATAPGQTAQPPGQASPPGRAPAPGGTPQPLRAFGVAEDGPAGPVGE